MASAITFVEVVERAKVEVATMLPHEVVITRTMRRMLDANGKSVTVEDVERRTMHYTYAGGQ